LKKIIQKKKKKKDIIVIIAETTMIKNLTTLKELEEFCKEQGLQFTKGEKKGFIITLNKNIHIDKEICCGRYSKMSFKLVEYYDDMIVVVKSEMDD
jgi:hypothetical protein